MSFRNSENFSGYRSELNFKIVIKILGLFLIFISLTTIFSILWSLHYGEFEVAMSFGYTILVGLISGIIMYLIGRKSDKESFYRKEGLAVVTFGWTISALLGALPFYFSGEIPSFVDAFFETMSGFTTTGATILTDIEILPKGLLFWRSFTHWLGGMGIIVLFVAILPAMGIGGKFMYKMEVPGVTKKGFTPRIKDTAIRLWLIYLILSLAEVISLMFCKMSFFDSLCHTFGTLATGGFSTKNASIGFYNSPLIEGIILIFMIFAGINFYLFYLTFQGKIKEVFSNPEIKVYLGIIFIVTLLITINVYSEGIYSNIYNALRYSVFQVCSIQTTTGYGTADFDLWPPLSRFLLVTLMLIGGSTGSTGGAMKVYRVIVIAKVSISQIFKFIRPRRIISIRIGKEVVPGESLDTILGFFVLYILILVFGGMFVSSMGVDLITSFTSVIATLGNIGPGLGRIGASQNYAFFPPIVKLFLSFCMLLGRLELFTVLVFFVPDFWKK